MDNAYIDFAYDYYKLCGNIHSKGYTSENINDFQRKLAINNVFFKSQKSMLIKATAESREIENELGVLDILGEYRNVAHIWELDVPFSEWILYVKQYIEFVRWSEKCFLYKNESSIDRDKSKYALYCEDKENTLYIRYFPNDVKVMINFTESLVNDITIDTTENNSIMDYVNSGKSPKKQINVEFVYINLNREFGKQMVNEFRFIISENPHYPDDSDKILMNTIQTIIGECVKMNFYDICDNYINKFANGDRYIKLEDFVNGAILFRH